MAVAVVTKMAQKVSMVMRSQMHSNYFGMVCYISYYYFLAIVIIQTWKIMLKIFPLDIYDIGPTAKETTYSTKKNNDVKMNV